MSREFTPQAALRAAIQVAKGNRPFARLIGKSHTAVGKMLSEGRVLPAEHVLTVERETGISRHLLRPDIYPREEGKPNG